MSNKVRGTVLIMLMTLMCGCSQHKNSSAQAVPDATKAEEATELQTISEEIVEPASEKTSEEIMEMLWDESELHGYDMFLYPGFTLGYSEENGQYHKTYTHDILCITAGGVDTDSEIQSDSGKTWIKISNGIIEKADKIALQIGGKNCEDTSWQERLFLMDLTGDGIDELVIRQQYAEMGLREAYLYVYDTETLERIEFSEDIDSILKSVISDASMTDKGEGNVEFNITDSKGGNCVIEKNIPENSQYEWAGVTSCKFIYFQDNQIKCVASAGYTSDDQIGICSVADVTVTLCYNSDTKCFEPEADYVIEESDETNDYYFDKVIIDKTLEEKAREALEEWN